MNRVARLFWLAVAISTPAAAQDSGGLGGGSVDGAGLDERPPSVYGTPEFVRPGEGFNDGAVHLDLGVDYRTDYVFRGIEPVEPDGGEDALNVGVDARLSFDLGRLPDPFVGVITNAAEGDAVSNFQVIRPLAGLRWDLELVDVEVGYQGFTYPDRDDLDTSEVFADVRLNDATFVGDEGPALGPYVFAAFDYDAFEGLYVEAGFDRDIPVGETALTIGYNAHVAYVDGLSELFAAPGAVDEEPDGFQHYEVSLRARYDLNETLNISRRYGQWAVEASLAYTDGIDNDLRAETQVWGRGGLVFRY